VIQSPPHLTGANNNPIPQRQKPPQGNGGFCKKESGGTCGGRTHDKRIKSPLLYQLS